MNSALPGIAALEAIGFSLLTLERRLNLAPTPELTRSANAWQIIFANPLERLDELVPPLPNGADRQVEETSEPPGQPGHMVPGLQPTVRPTGITPAAIQTSDAPRRTSLTQSTPASEYVQRAPDHPEYRPFDLGAAPALAAFSGGDPQLTAYSPAPTSQPAPRRANSGSAPTQASENSSQMADLSANQNSATRLVFNASGLAALLQANLNQSSLEPGSSFRPQTVPLEAQTAPLTAPADPAATFGSQTYDSASRRSRPAGFESLAAGEQAFTYPDFLPSAVAADALSGQSGQIQTAPAAVSSQPTSQTWPGQPSAPPSPDTFQTWLDDLELAYLRMYGTSGS
jgi:hypothetical protein